MPQRILRDMGAQLAAWPASAGSLSEGLGLSDSLAKPLIWIPTVCLTLLFGPAQALVLRWPVAPQGLGAKGDVAVLRFLHDLEREIIALNDSLGFASLARERVRVPELKAVALDGARKFPRRCLFCAQALNLADGAAKQIFPPIQPDVGDVPGPTCRSASGITRSGISPRREALRHLRR
jgi:hypothetical protein